MVKTTGQTISLGESCPSQNCLRIAINSTRDHILMCDHESLNTNTRWIWYDRRWLDYTFSNAHTFCIYVFEEYENKIRKSIHIHSFACCVEASKNINSKENMYMYSWMQRFSIYVLRKKQIYGHRKSNVYQYELVCFDIINDNIDALSFRIYSCSIYYSIKTDHFCQIHNLEVSNQFCSATILINTILNSIFPSVQF